MELVAFTVEGFRRFANKTSVKLVGGLIAFVGPNEAGKSSLLDAMAKLTVEDPFAETDKPRRSELVPTLSWHFKLSPEDKAALADIHDADHIERVVKTRRWSANDTWKLEPRRPQRDLSHRIPLAESIEELRPVLVSLGVDPNQIDIVTEILRADKETFPKDQVDALDWLAESATEALEPKEEPGDPGDLPAEDAIAEIDDEARARITELADTLQGAAELERKLHPFQQVISILRDRLPRMVLFSQADRDLQSEYDLNVVAANPPPALDHLRSLADLDLVALRDAARTNRRADVSTWRDNANRRLKEAFASSWHQTDIALQVDVDGSTLLVQATTPADAGVSSVDERSDGLRWFAALLAYSHGWSGPTVLLADEIETHLHYDAQADLIDVLQAQSFAQKVIYTTHSFGSLPPDLGAGVRVVRQIDTGRSQLENGFWAEGSGFSPLLARMGATAFSFTPARRAVIAEGPADAVLLPTLIRQATGLDRLDYQIVPGLSVVAISDIPSLAEEAGQVFFLTDSDGGGEDLRRHLLTSGVDESQVFELNPGATCELEDLVNVESYVAAVNAELETWNGGGDLVDPSVFDGQDLRSKILADWCSSRSAQAPDKVAVAQRLVEVGADDPILDPTKAGLLQSLNRAWAPSA